VCTSRAVNLLPLILVHVLEVLVAWENVSGCVGIQNIKRTYSTCWACWSR
jgi:hypothetical protein